MILCKENPKASENRKKSGEARRGKALSEDRRLRMSEAVQRKVQDGTWHVSFSKSRTHDYNGIKLYGMWEVKYAQWLDANQIKWRRPTEKFAYEFEGKIRYYTPDFYLEDANLYVEVKGYKTPKDEAKWRDFPLTLKVIQGKDLVAMGLLRDDEVKDLRIGSSTAS